jgi:hypothetical protein
MDRTSEEVREMHRGKLPLSGRRYKIYKVILRLYLTASLY